MTQTTSQAAAALSSKWRPYPAYKDSDVEWLGEIPAHWEVKRLKNIVTMNPEVLSEDTNPDYIIKYVDISNVDANGSVLGTQELRFEDAPSRARRIVKHGDTIISTVRTYLRAISLILHPPENIVVSTGFAVLRPKQDIYDKFLWRLVQSVGFVDAVVSHSEGVGYPAINPGILAGLTVWLPPFSEQQAIAAFLDRETARINTLIAKKEQLIALLQEKRAALISHAVTKGLDPAVKMKDSGVEWLGEIPEHWEVKRLKFVTSFVTSGSRGWAQYYSDDGPIFLRIGNLSRISIDIDLSDVQHVSPPKGTEGERTQVKQQDVLISITAYIGSIAVISETIGEAYVNQHIALTCPRTNLINSRWLGYCLLSNIGQEQFQLLINGGTKDGLSLDDVKNLFCLVPPLSEQQAIVAYLDRETAKIDALIARIRAGIAKVQEYSAALIAAAVTGKIDVRDGLYPT